MQCRLPLGPCRPASEELHSRVRLLRPRCIVGMPTVTGKWQTPANRAGRQRVACPPGLAWTGRTKTTAFDTTPPHHGIGTKV